MENVVCPQYSNILLATTKHNILLRKKLTKFLGAKTESGPRKQVIILLNLNKILFASLLMILPFTDAISADNDHDGVDDSLDECPNTAQLRKLSPYFAFAAAVNPERLKSGPVAYPVKENGCEPDDDHDGIVNSRDYCPKNSAHEIAKGVASNGCPVHTDHDGTPDYRDHCPDTPKEVRTDRFGCPRSTNYK